VIFDWLQEKGSYPNKAHRRTILGPSESRGRNSPARTVRPFIRRAHLRSRRSSPQPVPSITMRSCIMIWPNRFGDMPPNPCSNVDCGQVQRLAKWPMKTLEQAISRSLFESPGYRADDIYVAQNLWPPALWGRHCRAAMNSRVARTVDCAIRSLAAGKGPMPIQHDDGLCRHQVANRLPELGKPSPLTRMKAAASDIVPGRGSRGHGRR